jgi:hypothetical protein
MTGNTQSLNDRRPEQTVHNAWVDAFEEWGVDRGHGEVIVRAVFADDRLLHESLDADEITEVVRANLREVDFQPYIEEYGTGEFTEADEQELRDELIDELRAGLAGDLFGPSFANREVALEGPDSEADADETGEDDRKEDPHAEEPSLVGTKGPETTESPGKIEGGSLQERAVANMEAPAEGVRRRVEDTTDKSEGPPETVKQAVDALVELAHRDHADVRVSAIEALGDIGVDHPQVSERIIDTLVEMTTESDTTVAQSVAQELGRVAAAYSATQSDRPKNEGEDENV